MRLRMPRGVGSLFLFLVVLQARAEGLSYQKSLANRADILRPSAKELRWQEIPWLTSLVEARDVAKKEGRPILVWAADDDPFGRC